jgi:fatty-acyl-CoA synthase
MFSSVGDYLGRRDLYTPDAEAFVDFSKTPPLRLTFAQANARANRLARAFRAFGVHRGDCVAILARDGIEHLDCFFACGKIGATHVPLNWRSHWRENIDVLRRIRPRILLFSDDFAVAAAHFSHEEGVRKTIHLDGDGVERSESFNDVLAAHTDEPVIDPTLSEEHIAALIFTGGTTGLPKAAQISHRQIAWNALNAIIHDLRHGDRYLNVFPLFHTGGLFVYTLPLAILGGTTLLLRQFDAQRTLDLLDDERVTVFAGVPTMYQMMTAAANWETCALGTLRFCTSGGAPLPTQVIEKYWTEKSVRFKQGFGMTEFGPGAFALAPEDAVRKAGSIGRPNFFVDAGVVNDAGEFLPQDMEGELVLRGPSRSSGYFGNPEATAEAVDAAGWFHTGDVAKYDAEGYFFIVDRKKDMFISGGENVYPAEIERALYEHPAVEMCAVIGVPDEKWGEVGKAFVVLKPDCQVTESEALAFLRESLASYKTPKYVVFLEELPMAATGKILKRELKSLG